MQCRIIAAAIFGPQNDGANANAEFVSVSIPEMFPILANGTADLFVTGATHTMERQAFLNYANASFMFSTPYLYDGLRVGGLPEMVKCADDNFRHLNECAGLKVCVTSGTSHLMTLEQYLPDQLIVRMDFTRDGPVGIGLADGRCNVVINEGRSLTEAYVRNNGYNGTFVVGNSIYSNEPLSAGTRSGDAQFSDFVDSVIQALFAAEYHNITQQTAHLFPQTDVFGEEYKDMFRNAIAYAGNFGEVYRSDPTFPKQRVELNYVNDGTTSSGLLYSHPFGDVENARDSRVPLSANLTSVMERGYVRCGIRGGRPGFATKVDDDESTTGSSPYKGMDVEFCKLLAAGLFSTDTTAVEYVELENIQEGYALLAAGKLDVVAGATRTLQTEVKEPSTGIGFAFSTPYFYGYSEDEDNFSLATMEDHDWASYVYWMIMGTIFAEEQGIVQSDGYNQMPEVFVYGPELRRMFRDGILAIGNYAEIYNRTAGMVVERSGRNLLNQSPHLGPQQYVMPGII